MKFDISKAKKFMVGHRTFEIKWQRELIEDRYVGLMDKTRRVVTLQSGRAKEEEIETFFHEVIHSADFVLCEGLSERQTIRLGSLVAQAIMTLK